VNGAADRVSQVVMPEKRSLKYAIAYVAIALPLLIGAVRAADVLGLPWWAPACVLLLWLLLPDWVSDYRHGTLRGRKALAELSWLSLVGLLSATVLTVWPVLGTTIAIGTAMLAMLVLAWVLLHPRKAPLPAG
jgi:hypothetical protein